MVPEISTATDIFFWLSWAIFCPFTPPPLLPNSPKNENFKKMKKHPDISSFYTSVPQIMIMCYTLPEIWHVTHVNVIFHFGQFFALLPL